MVTEQLVIGAVTLLIAISLSSPITVLVATVTMIFLPFHFPLPVLELRFRYPDFIMARNWLRIRHVDIR